MGDQLLVIVAVLLALVAAIAGSSYVFAITAEPAREPDPKEHAESLR